MRKVILVAATAAIAFVSASPAFAGPDKSSGRKDQDRGMRQMPHCAKPLGTISIVEPDNQWWRQYSLGSPEAIIKVFVQESNCFTLVNRGRAMQSRAMERALADNGELQRGSNMGKGQVRAADFLLEPDIVSSNNNSGGSNVGGAIGGVLSRFGGGARAIGSLAGGVNIKKGEANVTLSVVDSRTTEEHVVEGYFRKTDVGFGASAGASWWGGFASAGGGGYQNTEIGQIIVLAYLDAYSKLVTQLGGS
ncbi:MAG: CsgG/HfaB family protein [Sphingomonas sp.]|uniref:CsgG/HfaB family protein n=1 Tax=Sphingomonas sp. TaxID=28214 RepID=UPI003F813B51